MGNLCEITGSVALTLGHGSQDRWQHDHRNLTSLCASTSRIAHFFVFLYRSKAGKKHQRDQRLMSIYLLEISVRDSSCLPLPRLTLPLKAYIVTDGGTTAVIADSAEDLKKCQSWRGRF